MLFCTDEIRMRLNRPASPNRGDTEKKEEEEKEVVEEKNVEEYQCIAKLLL